MGPESSISQNIQKIKNKKIKKCWENIRSFLRAGSFREKYENFFSGKNFEAGAGKSTNILYSP